ncbi:MAG: transporter substrate-binding protein [Herbinix sp.]|nr:transporter substrate-binding protein [Herbinix sp.]
MKMKKVIAMLAACTLLAASFVGCAKDTSKDNTDTSTPTTAPAETDSTDATDDAATDEIVTLKWITVGGGMPTNYDAWQKNINEYLGEKIGVNVEMEVVSWGDWDNRRNIIVNSGESFDILFTDGNKYNAASKLGAFLDITELAKTAAPELYSYIPEAYWNAVKVDGKVFAVPTYKDSSATNYFVYDTEKATKYNVNFVGIKNFSELTDGLMAMKDGEGVTPFILANDGAGVVTANYDNMGAGFRPLGVRFDDQSRKVVSIFEQEDILTELDTLHQWYEAGIINADAPTLAESPSYRMVYNAQGWSGAAKTTWGPNMGVEATADQFGDTIVSNDTVRGSLNAVYASSKYPEKCLQLLQLVNLDTKVRDAFYYGLEGENFNYTADGKIEKINNDWNMAGYTQGTFFTVSQLADADFNQWDEVKELNANAKPSVLLGFTFDTTTVETELAQCNAVFDKYKSVLLTGAQEPRELVAQMREELNAAGFETLITEAQAQVDAAFAQ